MNDFILGVVSSLVATFIIFIFRHQVGYLINILFFKVYPNLSGEYNVYVYNIESDNEIDYEDEDEEIDLEQPVPSISNSSNSNLLQYLKETDAEPFMKATVKQFAYKLEGSITTIEKGQIIDNEKFKGRVTPSRVVLLNTETVTPEHHNFGTYLLRLTPNNKVMKGSRNYLCTECGDVGNSYVMFEKIK